MKKLIALVVAGCFWAVTAEGEETSLFFTPDEVHAVETLASKTAHAEGDNGDVHLGAVFYYGPEDWVLWLQGTRWTPATQRADLRVVQVQPDAVRLSLAAAPGMALREVTLKPYQTYQLSTGMVVEGSTSSVSSLSR